jgi:hypothetical protein
VSADVPCDPQTGGVPFVPKIAAVKELPANMLQITLLAVGPGSAREVRR